MPKKINRPQPGLNPRTLDFEANTLPFILLITNKLDNQLTQWFMERGFSNFTLEICQKLRSCRK